MTTASQMIGETYDASTGRVPGWMRIDSDTDLIYAVADAIAPGGYITATLRYQPSYSSSDIPITHTLLYFDDETMLHYVRAGGSARFDWTVAGETIMVTSLTFSAEQELKITVEHSEERRALIVSGATSGNGEATGDPLLALSLPTHALLLGPPAGPEEDSDLIAFEPALTTFCQLADDRALAQMGDDAGERNFRDLLCVLAEQLGRFRDVCLAVRSAFDLETAVGEQLDMIGSVVGLAREGFDDDRYRTFLRIQSELLLSAARDGAEWTGTCENILRIARTFIGSTAGPITLTNGVYDYLLVVPELVPSEAQLLARFLRTATYAGVLGVLALAGAGDSLWGSDAVAVTGAGIWDSDSVSITDPAEWGSVVTTL